MRKCENNKKFEKNRLLHSFSPFIIFGVAIILVPIFVLMTMDNIREQNGRTIEKLTGKGIFLIRAFEAGTRTGMLTMSWSVERVQSLLTETSLQPEVEYMMITDIQGTILAHSDPSKVGGKYANMPDIKMLNSDSKVFVPKGNRADLDSKATVNADSSNADHLIWHRELESENGYKIFQVFKWFTPANRRFRAGKPPIPFCVVDQGIECSVDSKGCINSQLYSHIRDMDWFKIHFLSPKHSKISQEHQKQIIFAALDMSEVEIAKAKYLRHVIAMGFMFFVLGCTGVVGIIAFQGYRSAKTSISELKSEIERSRRLAAVGKLAAGVAHEIRNPLSSIKGFATYFKERYSNVKDDTEVADIMIQEVERLNRAVTQLLEFAKPLPVIAKEINLKDLIAHSVKLIEYDKSQKDISVKIDYKLNSENIITDPDRLNQILLNLYLNAVQAMDKNGKLTIMVKDYHHSKDFKIDDKKVYSANLHKKSVEQVKDKILIEVADTGKGIEEKDIEHIFDPYFTTRPEGSGLGLSVVHRAVEALGGEIRVESKQGVDVGTTFFIAIPCK